MEWRDRGVVLHARTHGETSVILELLTAQHGRHLGVVRGGRSRRLRPVLQTGNSVSAVWRARIDDHLGTFLVEASAARSAVLFASAIALHAANHLTGLARLLPERDPHPALFAMVETMLNNIDDREVLALQLIQFELALLAELGYGLDLDRCAATGDRSDLVFVSPRTGRAVCRQAGEPYRDRMLALPSFLRPGEGAQAVTNQDLAAAFRLTEHFLVRDVLAERDASLGSARRAYLALLLS